MSNVDTLDVQKRLVDGDETQYNLLRLRDQLWQDTRDDPSIANPLVVLCLKINSCLYRDRNGKAKAN